MPEFKGAEYKMKERKFKVKPPKKATIDGMYVKGTAGKARKAKKGSFKITPGKAKYVETKRPVKRSIMDARAITDVTSVEAMERGRLRYEKKIGKQLEKKMESLGY